jgi:hypothetical protein
MDMECLPDLAGKPGAKAGRRKAKIGAGAAAD